MMKVLDYIVLAVMVIGLVILCFLQECSWDIYFLIFGFAVAAMAAVTMYLQNRSKKESEEAPE